MRKFSKIFESKETLLSKLGSSEDEIRDMCSELIDEGYDITVSNEYIGLDGGIYYDENKTSRYYPCIKVDLHRETANKDEYGSRSSQKDQFNDVRNWNGGVYYEGNINMLKSIYELCYRFESTFTSDKANVYFSMRSINEVMIRVTFGVEESTGQIDFSAIDRFLSNDALYLHDDYYEVEDSISFGDSRTRNITIEAKDSNRKHEIVKRMLDSEQKDDSKYLDQIVKQYVNRVLEEAKKGAKSAIKVVSRGSNATYDFRYYIVCDGETLISFEGDYPIKDEREIIVAKGIFKDKKETITIRSIEMKIKLNYS